MQANKFAGADGYTGLEIIDRGQWDNPLFDPETASNGDVFFPLGPWPEGILVISELTD
jgi:hypothetical protein